MKRKVSSVLGYVFATIAGIVLGMLFTQLHYEARLADLEYRAATVELQTHLLEHDLDEVTVLKYFIRETYKDLQRLSIAIDNLVPRRVE